MGNEGSSEAMSDPGRRFDRLTRLVGAEGLDRLKRAHVMVIGLGGVGSWAAEAVARSAVGRITLVDFDTVCIRNFNRQLQAVEGSVGKPKADLLAARLRSINPEAEIEGVADRFSPETCEGLMARGPDFIIDAIDHVTSKCFLIDYCRRTSRKMVVSTGSGGRLDPTQVRVVDLGLTERDPLARAVRGILREKYGFPARGAFGIPSVCTFEPHRPPFSPTLPDFPLENRHSVQKHTTGQPSPLPTSDFPPDPTDCKAGCLCPQGENDFNSCTRKSVVLGTAAFVTGAFGLACASAAVKSLLEGR